MVEVAILTEPTMSLRWRALRFGEDSPFELPMGDGRDLDFPYVLEQKWVNHDGSEVFWHCVEIVSIPLSALDS